MMYSQFVKAVFRACYGEPPERSAGAGLVLVADGVGGLDLCAVGMRYVAGHAQLPFQIRTLGWGHGFGRWHADLTDTSHLEAQAELAAHDVVEFLKEHPGSPVFLVGKSGGTGVVVKALERLDDGTVQAAVLLSSALSPRYDLTRALRALRREMVAFWSPLDVFVLGMGTLVLGTIDRKRSLSAGLVGFRRPKHPSAEQAAQYAKLRQVRWHPAMAPTGYMGGHVGPDCPAFLRKYVVPLLSSATSSGDANSAPCQAGAAEGR